LLYVCFWAAYSKEESVDIKDYDFYQLKKGMLLIYKGVLSGPVKHKNKALVKHTAKEYSPNKIDIFNDDDE
jgi:hypothetical protein